MANSLRPGTPILRTKITPSGAVQSGSHLGGNRYAAARKCQHYWPLQCGLSDQRIRECAAGDCAVGVAGRALRRRITVGLALVNLERAAVDLDGLGGDLGPVELLDAALPSRQSELPSLLRIGRQRVDLGCQPVLKGGDGPGSSAVAGS